MKLVKQMQKNVDAIKKEFSSPEMLLTRELLIDKKINATALFITDLTDSEKIANSVIRPCLSAKINANSGIDKIIKNAIGGAEIEETDDSGTCAKNLLVGSVILIIEGYTKALSIKCDHLEKRAVVEPPTSAVIKGPREGFVENIKTNKNLLFQQLTTSKLVFEQVKVGRYSQTDCAVAYIDGVADAKMAKRILERIKKIDIDGIIDSFYVASFLEEHPLSIFKQVGTAEKPDIVAGKLLEGRIAVIVDRSPIVLTLPFALIEDLQSSDDYYNRNFKVTFARFLRFIGIIVAIILPGIYVAMQLYHYRIIPIKFLITIVNSTQGLPMTPFFEILFIIFLFEILYEASLHMPKYLGTALSLVGALILGDTAVKAGLISSPSVMIVALSGIMIYTLPDQVSQATILRLIFVMLGGIFGLFGIVGGIFIVSAYLVSFENYGTPYLAPLAPYIKNDTQDFLNKRNITQIKMRPEMLKIKNKTRKG